MPATDPAPAPAAGRNLFWFYARALAAPALLWVLVVAALRVPLEAWLRGENTYDIAALQEWPDEARSFRETLPEIGEDYPSRVRIRPGLPRAPITWDSGLPSDSGQYRELEHRIHPGATVYLRYQLHAYNKRQRVEQEHAQRARQLTVLAGAATLLVLGWVVLVQRRERERERQR